MVGWVFGTSKLGMLNVSCSRLSRIWAVLVVLQGPATHLHVPVPAQCMEQALDDVIICNRPSNAMMDTLLVSISCTTFMLLRLVLPSKS